MFVFLDILLAIQSFDELYLTLLVKPYYFTFLHCIWGLPVWLSQFLSLCHPLGYRELTISIARWPPKLSDSLFQELSTYAWLHWFDDQSDCFMSACRFYSFLIQSLALSSLAFCSRWIIVVPPPSMTALLAQDLFPPLSLQGFWFSHNTLQMHFCLPKLSNSTILWQYWPNLYTYHGPLLQAQISFFKRFAISIWG